MKTILLMMGAALAAVAPGATQAAECDVTYFLVANIAPGEPQTDSYVIPIHHPEDLAMARSILSGEIPVEEARVLTPALYVELEPRDYNRNHLAPRAPKWSWSLSYEAFRDVRDEKIVWGGSLSRTTIRGTTPTELERLLLTGDGRSQQELKGFMLLLDRSHYAPSDYNVVAELGSHPCIEISLTLTEDGRELAWTDLGIHYSYTVEVADDTLSSWVGC